MEQKIENFSILCMESVLIKSKTSPARDCYCHNYSALRNIEMKSQAFKNKHCQQENFAFKNEVKHFQRDRIIPH